NELSFGNEVCWSTANVIRSCFNESVYIGLHPCRRRSTIKCSSALTRKHRASYVTTSDRRPYSRCTDVATASHSAGRAVVAIIDNDIEGCRGAAWCYESQATNSYPSTKRIYASFQNAAKQVTARTK